MAKFIEAYNLTAINEGGYTNNPDDNGNWTGGKKGIGVLIGTNRGVSAPVLMKFLKHVPSVEEMKALPSATAQEIYKKNYWDVIRGDEWNNQKAANEVYDMAVNAGCAAAISLWQGTIGVPVTGKMDFTTMKATNLHT